jgi:hypothetical protein
MAILGFKRQPGYVPSDAHDDEASCSFLSVILEFILRENSTGTGNGSDLGSDADTSTGSSFSPPTPEAFNFVFRRNEDSSTRKRQRL